jgi:F420-dependent oxidoreductase-like protein
MKRIRFGVQALQGMPDYASLKKVVLECERLKFDSVWVYDHLHFSYGPTLECWTVLAALAEATKSIRIGPLVTCNAYRYPSILAKVAATVDMISNGRLNFGIGAGWLKEEAIAYGIPFPRGRERVEMLDEALTIIRQLWTKDKAEFKGKYYSLSGAVCLPKPTQTPHPPILVGGGTGTKMLRVIAKHADAWDMGFETSEEIKGDLAKLKEACSEVGRDPNTIENTYQSRVIIADEDEDAFARAEKWREERHGKKDDPDWKTAIVGSPKKCIDQLKSLVDVGITSFNLLFADVLKLEPLRLFSGEVIPDFQE